jgi:ribose transport system permease protein
VKEEVQQLEPFAQRLRTHGPAMTQRLPRLFLEYGMFWVLVVLLIAAEPVYSGFYEVQNIKNLLSQAAPVGIVAVGMTFVIIAGGFDLSVGSIFALGAVFFASLAPHMPLFADGLLTALIGASAGAVNGIIVTKLKVNPFVATLGTASMFGGAAFIYSHSAPFTVYKSGFETLGTGSWGGFPISIYLMIIAFVLGGIVLSRRVYGRSIYAIGGNDEAARLAGLRVDVLRGSTYVITGLCSAIGGMILASRLGVGQADMGANVALDSIAIVVIGGTSLLGGEGAMWRTAVGLLIIATLTNIFDSLAISNNYQLVVKGAIVIGAVALDIFARSRQV